MFDLSSSMFWKVERKRSQMAGSDMVDLTKAMASAPSVNLTSGSCHSRAMWKDQVNGSSGSSTF